MRGRRHKLQVSTFPFLAVLLCAMGSLILVLLVMDRKAHQAALARAQREAARLAEESARTEANRQTQRERSKQEARAAWEQKRDALHAKLTSAQMELEVQMKKVREQLRDIAARLHYEQDTTTQLRRKVQDERSRLEAERQLLLTLKTSSAKSDTQSKEANKTLQRMTIDLLQMEQVLKDLKASRQREQQTFSVVPYHGRRGETRRPIYVECTGAGVIFHPERRAMPVTADVRAEVERRIALQRAKLSKLPDNTDNTPYLLLLLRPEGVMTYHMLQSALKGLPLDFGYEFIDPDWILDFPANDALPSAQPWMVATKTNAPAAGAPAPAMKGTRPVGLAPAGTTGVRSPNAGLRSFQAGEGGGGTWVRGTARPGAQGMGGPGGGSAYPSVAGSESGAGMGGGGVPGGYQGGGLLGGSGIGNPPGLTGQANATGSGLADATSVGGSGASGGGSGLGLRRGSGRGHPAALAPSLPEGDGGNGFSGDGPPASGSRGSFSLRGSGSPSGSGSAMAGSSESGGSDGPGLGPPQALSGSSPGMPSAGTKIAGTSQDGPLAGGGGPGGSSTLGTNIVGIPTGNMGGSGLTGNGFTGNGTSGNGASGSGNTGLPYSGGSSTSAREVIARGNNEPTGPAGGGNGGGNGPATPGATMPGIPGAVGQPAGTMTIGPAAAGASQMPFPASGTQTTGPLDPNVQAALRSNPGAQGNGGSASGSTMNTGGRPGGQSATGAPPAANGNRSPNAVIYVDPLTGKQTTPPNPPASVDAQSSEAPPQETDPSKPPPRARVIVGSGGGSGEPGDPEEARAHRFDPPVAPVHQPAARKPAALRPAWVHGGRDWIIYIECRADALVLYPSQRQFSIAQVISNPAGNPLVKAIGQMIAQRQALRRPNEPPYRPQVCLLVRPENVRAFLRVYRDLGALGVPLTRRNLDPEDDVISIVTGSNP